LSKDFDSTVNVLTEFLMRLKLTSIVLAIIGGIMFAIGVNRGYYPYTSEGSYFDSETGIIYQEQTTELLQICGFLLLAAGVVMFIRNRKRLAHDVRA
jgi:hypothetical protein